MPQSPKPRYASSAPIAPTVFLAAVFGMTAVPAAAQENPCNTPGGGDVPCLAVPIPNLNFSGVTRTKENGVTYANVPFLAEYINAVYQYAVYIGVIVAAMFAIVGGFEWLTAGDSGRVAKAKERISNSLIGLLLTLGAYAMLNTVNPDFTKLTTLSVPITESVELSGDTNTPVKDEDLQNAPSAVYCPKSGGFLAISQIATSMSGNVFYRFGGKGGKPPYAEIKSEYLKYNGTCPEGKLCLDCSGFVNYVLRCAGMSAPSGGTATIFSGSEDIKTIDDLGGGVVIVNGDRSRPLKPGDLLGHLPSEGKLGIGHVYIFAGCIGGGNEPLSPTCRSSIIESHGGIDGREGMDNPRANAISNQLVVSRKVLHLKRSN